MGLCMGWVCVCAPQVQGSVGSLPEGPRVEARMISAFPGASMLRLAVQALGLVSMRGERGERQALQGMYDAYPPGAEAEQGIGV